MIHNHVLDRSLDTGAAMPLAATLKRLTAEAKGIRLDGAPVERSGLACLQVLLAAKTSADQAGTGFVIDRPSANLAEAIGLLGLHTLLAPVE